ncbi:Transposase [Pseudomonas savastanoi pv. phaseolicola]|nr:Transposase [Pseudomonas savastanoi pv. phaseolicola]
MKRIAVDLAKSVYQIAEIVRVSQRKRLNREAFQRYIQEEIEPVESVMEACNTAR